MVIGPRAGFLGFFPARGLFRGVAWATLPAVDGWERIAKEILAAPELSEPEERALFRRIAAGDDEARRDLIAANLRHAIPIANALAKSGQRWEPGDLLGEAVRAMDGLAKRWNGSGRFGLYAKARIRGAMKDFLRRRADVMRTPNDAPRALSLEASEDDEPGGLLATLAGEEPETDGFRLPPLTERERQVLELTILARPPGTPEDAAEALGLSLAYVGRVLRAALRKRAE